MSDRPAQPDHRWPLERILFAMAGTVILASVALASFVSSWFLLLTTLVGVSQWLFAAFGACPASLVLVHVFGVRRGRWGVGGCQSSQPSRL
jgi:hypothetical protein